MAKKRKAKVCDSCKCPFEANRKNCPFNENIVGCPYLVKVKR